MQGNGMAVVLGDAARGLAQQMVWWGHDVRHAGGNGLVRLGMVREASKGLTGTSCYCEEWEGGRVQLHGAVASWTAPVGGVGCVFCRDRQRIDLWVGEDLPVPGLHRPQGVEGGSGDERWEAFRPLLRWLIRYEERALELFGAEWREGCWKQIRRLPKGKPWLEPGVALRWWRLAEEGRAPRAKKFSRSNTNQSNYH